MRASVNRTARGSAVRRQLVDHRAAGITEPEQLGDLVESLAGGIVARLAEQAVGETFAHFKKMRVAAADHQRQRRIFDRMAVARGFKHHRVNVSFDVIDADERNAARETQRLGVRDAHQQRSNQARPGGDCDRRKIRKRRSGRSQRLADYGHDGAQMLARG